MKKVVYFLFLSVFCAIPFIDKAQTNAVSDDNSAYILTPPSSPKPRINSAKVFGVRPGSPFLFTVAATGERPMLFTAKNLPAGLQLDPFTGRITGMLNIQSNYIVKLYAKNHRGKATQFFEIVCGPHIGLTPAMGWNSWNCFAHAVTEKDVKAAADAMVASGLINHGWTYINVDDYWQVHREPNTDPTLRGPERDAQGRILANPRFPDMKGMADYIHNLGLRAGLYSSPGPWTCGGCVGSFDHELQDAQQYAAWGFDYLKYDWCSYAPSLERLRNNFTNDLAFKSFGNGAATNREQLMLPYQIMRSALNTQHRDIIYSLCQYGRGNVWEWGAQVGGNSWRTTGDIRDNWRSMSRIGFNQNGHEPYAGPGHFNDPDMLVVGKLGWGNLHPTGLTPNEQYTHISLWCLLAAPLLIGCDMTQLDPFTLSLLSNDEVIEVDQDPLGKQASRISKSPGVEVWARELDDGSRAVGLFNRGEAPAPVSVSFFSLGLKEKGFLGDQFLGGHRVRDLWRQKDLGRYRDYFNAQVPPHGVVLVRIW